MKDKKMWIIAIIGVVGIGAACFLGVQSCRNKAITLEEAVETAKSDIEVQEKKRIDLVYNMADCVKQYDQYEAEVIEKLAESRKTEGATTTIKAIAEDYPELKSNEQYKTLMLELATLENEISQHRTAYNKAVERYNRYTRKYLQEKFLSWIGYEKKNYERLEYNAPEDAPQDLFGDE